MQGILSKLGHRKFIGLFIGLGAGIVVGACIIAACFAMLSASPQSNDMAPSDARHLKAPAFIDVSLQVARQDTVTQNDQSRLFGMETEPVAGELAAKWRAVLGENRIPPSNVPPTSAERVAGARSDAGSAS